MNDSVTIGDIIGPIVCLLLVYGLYKLLYGSPRPRAVRYLAPPPPVGSGNKGGAGERSEAERQRGGPPPYIGEPQQRLVYAVLDNPHSHPYDNLPLTELHDHLFNDHFEVFNMTVQRDASPEKWRREHALDHGMVLR